MTEDKTKTSIKTKTPPKLVAFDAARYLDDDEAVAEYMTAILETNDPNLLLLALSDVAAQKAWRRWLKMQASARKSLQGTFPRGQTTVRDRHEGCPSVGRQVHCAACLKHTDRTISPGERQPRDLASAR